MYQHIVRFLLMACAAMPLMAAVATARMDGAELSRLATLKVGEAVEVGAFPVGVGRVAKLRFERIDIYAPGARIVEITATGERELPRIPRIDLIGTSADGSARVALSFAPDLRSAPRGAGFGGSGDFALVAERSGTGWSFSAVEPAAVLPPGVVPKYLPNEDSLVAAGAGASPLDGLQASLMPQPSATTPARIAVVAVDTDASFLSKRFSNNTANATTWIADLFVQMNVIYRRDLDVILQQGTTFLRVGSDPYPNADSGATQAQLVEFGNYWSANYSSGANAVSRSFAMLLSGNLSSGNSASGIAWVGSYCQTGGTGGSYSANQVFTNPSIPVASSNSIVAHEIGHNFGAYHTHCSNSSTGIGPATTNTIDQCYNSEGSSCYTGATSCPAGGSGTLMSYCHLGACGSASNQLQFAPAHISRLRSLIANNTPSCLRNETILTTGFDS